MACGSKTRKPDAISAAGKMERGKTWGVTDWQKSLLNNRWLNAVVQQINQKTFVRRNLTSDPNFFGSAGNRQPGLRVI